MQTLTAEEKQNLVEIVIEDFGLELTFDDFSDAVLGLFEDIPGFETIGVIICFTTGVIVGFEATGRILHFVTMDVIVGFETTHIIAL